MTPIQLINGETDEVHPKDEVIASWNLLEKKGIKFDSKFIEKQDHSLCRKSFNESIDFIAEKMAALSPEETEKWKTQKEEA